MPRLACLFAAVALFLSGCNIFLRPEPSPDPEPPPYIPSQEPIAYYPFSGNARDASGNGYHGIVQGATLTADRFGNADAAYAFSGDDMIDLGDVFNDVRLPLTISGWMKASTFQEGRVFSTENDPLYPMSRYYGVHLSISSGELRAHVLDGGLPGYQYRRTKNVSLEETGAWKHVAAVIRGLTDMTIYVNGQDAGGYYDGEGGPLMHNEWHAAIGKFFIGDLDDVALYNRPLTPAEVDSLYTAGN